MRFADGFFDDRAALLWSPASEDQGSDRRHRVRESAWYALGLMQRNQPGDRARALRIVDAVLAQQITAPGEPYHGTFYRAPEEPPPPPDAKPWTDYDPNWRQFIGTTFALLLEDYGAALPPSLPPRLLASIQLAVEGELQQHRLVPSYTNIALMQGYLWAFAADRMHRTEWAQPAAEWTEAVHTLFAEHGTFEEYNSPTYYGVDLYGLALWRKHGVTARQRDLGASMEAALWRDIAEFYHPGLRNLCGPFDRSYGMDMRHYVSLTGVWMALALPSGIAPLPDPDGPMEHAHDFVFAPLFVLLEPRIPDDVQARFRQFSGEHSLTRIITPQRTATAWLGDRVMLGGESTTFTKAAGTPGNQFHPATMHWQTPDHDVGWMVLRSAPRVNARAAANSLTIDAIGTSIFRLSAPGLHARDLSRNRWSLPGLLVEIETDATGMQVVEGRGWVDVTYREATRFVLHPKVQP